MKINEKKKTLRQMRKCHSIEEEKLNFNAVEILVIKEMIILNI
jgi:hypothetical protein